MRLTHMAIFGEIKFAWLSFDEATVAEFHQLYKNCVFAMFYLPESAGHIQKITWM
jgi:hypothetical protein